MLLILDVRHKGDQYSAGGWVWTYLLTYWANMSFFFASMCFSKLLMTFPEDTIWQIAEQWYRTEMNGTWGMQWFYYHIRSIWIYKCLWYWKELKNTFILSKIYQISKMFHKNIVILLIDNNFLIILSDCVGLRCAWKDD